MGKRCVYLLKGSKKVGSPKSKTQPGLMTRTRRICEVHFQAQLARTRYWPEDQGLHVPQLHLRWREKGTQKTSAESDKINSNLKGKHTKSKQ